MNLARYALEVCGISFILSAAWLIHPIAGMILTGVALVWVAQLRLGRTSHDDP